MMKKLFVIFTVLALTAFQTGWKVHDFENFQIAMPKEWKNHKLEGIDSSFGKFTHHGVVLEYSYNEEGFAVDPLREAAKEFDDEDTDPAFIQKYNVERRTEKGLAITTIWPKVAGRGITGIYVHDAVKTNINEEPILSFSMYGRNLSPNNQAMALQAFKTVKFKL